MARVKRNGRKVHWRVKEGARTSCDSSRFPLRSRARMTPVQESAHVLRQAYIAFGTVMRVLWRHLMECSAAHIRSAPGGARAGPRENSVEQRCAVLGESFPAFCWPVMRPSTTLSSLLSRTSTIVLQFLVRNCSVPETSTQEFSVTEISMQEFSVQ